MPITYLPDDVWSQLVARLVERGEGDLPDFLDLRSAIAIDLAELAGICPEYTRADAEAAAG